MILSVAGRRTAPLIIFWLSEYNYFSGFTSLWRKKSLKQNRIDKILYRGSLFSNFLELTTTHEDIGYDCDGNWLGRLSNQDAEKIDLNRVEYLTGKAGTITIHNARTLHYSPSSKKNKPRPLLLFCYTAADAKPYTPHPQPTENSYKIIRGNAPVWAEHDPRPCQLPPDWSKGYTSIYAAQSGEDSKK